MGKDLWGLGRHCPMRDGLNCLTSPLCVVEYNIQISDF